MTSATAPAARSSIWRRAGHLLAVYYAYMVEYRAELFLWALANSLSFILMGVWYEATGRGNFALQPLDVVRYFLAVFVVRQLTVVWVIWEVEADVQRGRMSHFLLSPLDPFWRYLSAHVAERGARLPFSVGLVVLFFVLYPPAFFVPHPAHALWALFFCVVGFTLRFLIQYTLALLSFWTERASALESLMFIVYMFGSGAIAPLDVFPPEARAVALYTPFPYLVWVPARVLLGDAGGAGGQGVDVTRALVVSAVWFVVLVVVNRAVWRFALRHHSAMGA